MGRTLEAGASQPAHDVRLDLQDHLDYFACSGEIRLAHRQVNVSL